MSQVLIVCLNIYGFVMDTGAKWLKSNPFCQDTRFHLIRIYFSNIQCVKYIGYWIRECLCFLYPRVFGLNMEIWRHLSVILCIQSIYATIWKFENILYSCVPYTEKRVFMSIQAHALFLCIYIYVYILYGDRFIYCMYLYVYIKHYTYIFLLHI